VLIYETFAHGNQSVGKPSNPAFLLAPGELLEVVRPRLRVVAFQDGFLAQPRPAYVQRICAILEAHPASGDTQRITPALLRTGWLIRYNRGLLIKFMAFHD
jgi:hypothetical protein